MDPEGAPDEYNLDAILGHEEKYGKFFFKVKWEGYEDPSVEPAGNFFQQFSKPLIDYGCEHGLKMDIFKELSGRGCICEASGARSHGGAFPGSQGGGVL